MAGKVYSICSTPAVLDLTEPCSDSHRIVPAFGWHPWFSHHLFDETKYGSVSSLTSEQKQTHYESVLTPKPDDLAFLHSLPDPRPLGDLVQHSRYHLSRYPLALVGEVGLDKSCRVPYTWRSEQKPDRDNSLTPGGREGRTLTPYRVSMDHQRKVLLAQLRLAGETKRAVSLHGVAAHGVLYETLAETWRGYERHVPSKRERLREKAALKAKAGPQQVEDHVATEAGPMPYPPRVCLHSFSGPPETVKQYTAPTIPCEIYFSFSTTINTWTEGSDGKVEAAVRAVPHDRLLVESDLHIAGDRMDGYLEAVVREICKVKGWELEDGVIRLGENWKRFISGQ